MHRTTIVGKHLHVKVFYMPQLSHPNHVLILSQMSNGFLWSFIGNNPWHTKVIYSNIWAWNDTLGGWNFDLLLVVLHNVLWVVRESESENRQAVGGSFHAIHGGYISAKKIIKGRILHTFCVWFPAEVNDYFNHWHFQL